MRPRRGLVSRKAAAIANRRETGSPARRRLTAAAGIEPGTGINPYSPEAPVGARPVEASAFVRRREGHAIAQVDPVRQLDLGEQRG
jgi:hypothetical protein